METDHLFHAQLAEILDDDGQALLDDRHPGKMGVDGRAHEFRTEDDGRGDILEDFSGAQRPQVGNEAAGEGLVLHVADQVLALHRVMLIHWLVMGRGAVNMPFSSRRSADEIEGMITPRAVFLAGIAGDAFGKHPGILPLDDLHHFSVRLLMPAKDMYWHFRRQSAEGQVAQTFSLNFSEYIERLHVRVGEN